jgi:8-amino-3,8-dideoxy-alpha-D-manno-octulosonate transaminase
MGIAEKNNLLVLEDNAQSCGGQYRGRMLGTIGNAGITSFDFGKVLTTGEGGMIMTNDPGIFRKSREYSDHGHELNPRFPRGEDTRSICGFNYKMMELQGAIGLVQLRKMDSIIQSQRRNKKAVKDGISDIPEIEFRNVPNPEGDTGDSVIFFLKDKQRTEQFMKAWTAKGFGTKNLPDAINWHFAGTWDHILGRYPRYRGRDLEPVFRQSSDILRRAIAIPIMMNMDAAQIDRIITAVHDCVKG